MKKILLIVLALILCLGLAACGGEKPEPENKDPEVKVEEPKEKPEEKPAEKPAENAKGVARDYWYGDWEGYIYVADGWGELADSATIFGDLEAVITTDPNTYLDYIEAFAPGDEENPVFSFYIEIDDDKVKPIFEEEGEDAFIFNRYLRPEDEAFFTTPNNMASPTIKYEYEFEDPDDPDTGGIFIFALKKVGESWDDEEVKPPKYK